MLLFQVGIIASLFAMSANSPLPSDGPEKLSLFLATAFMLAFFSASQDIVIDAYKRERLPNEEFGLGNSFAVIGYRFGMMGATSLAPLLSSNIPWSLVYQIMAALMGVGILTTLLCQEPEEPKNNVSKSLLSAFWLPLKDYFQIQNSIVYLAFILLYKLGDSLASEMLKPFYSKVGYSNEMIGLVAGQVGIWSAIAGGAVGGIVLLNFKLRSVLFIFGILQALSTFAIAALAWLPVSALNLGAIIFFETFTGGLGTAAFVTFVAGLTKKSFTATQYALLSSLTKIPLAILGMTTGLLISYFQTLGQQHFSNNLSPELFGFSAFFICCGFVAIPGLLMLKFYQFQEREDA